MQNFADWYKRERQSQALKSAIKCYIEATRRNTYHLVRTATNTEKALPSMLRSNLEEINRPLCS